MTSKCLPKWSQKSKKRSKIDPCAPEGPFGAPGPHFGRPGSHFGGKIGHFCTSRSTFSTFFSKKSGTLHSSGTFHSSGTIFVFQIVSLFLPKTCQNPARNQAHQRRPRVPKTSGGGLGAANYNIVLSSLHLSFKVILKTSPKHRNITTTPPK